MGVLPLSVGVCVGRGAHQHEYSRHTVRALQQPTQGTYVLCSEHIIAINSGYVILCVTIWALNCNQLRVCMCHHPNTPAINSGYVCVTIRAPWQSTRGMYVSPSEHICNQLRVCMCQHLSTLWNNSWPYLYLSPSCNQLRINIYVSPAEFLSNQLSLCMCYWWLARCEEILPKNNCIIIMIMSWCFHDVVVMLL